MTSGSTSEDGGAWLELQRVQCKSGVTLQTTEMGFSPRIRGRDRRAVMTVLRRSKTGEACARSAS